MTEQPNETFPGPPELHRPRPLLAILYTALAPGLGLIYVGRLLAGLVVNLMVVLVLLVFIVLASVTKLFPLYPALVLLAGWLVLASLAAWRSVEIIDQEEPTSPRPFQHPIFYALIAVMTYAAPLGVTLQFTVHNLYDVQAVDSLAMYPQAQPGDRILIDRTVFRSTRPARGDLVAVRVPDTGEIAMLRVVGVPSDQVQMHGFTIFINDEILDFSPLDPSWIVQGEIDDELDLEVVVEHNHDSRYVVALSPQGPADHAVSGMELGTDTYFVLADNRSALLDGAPQDSRSFGPVPRDRIEGRPLYIAWSSHPETGSTRWGRIGLPTD